MILQENNRNLIKIQVRFHPFCTTREDQMRTQSVAIYRLLSCFFSLCETTPIVCWCGSINRASPDRPSHSVPVDLLPRWSKRWIRNSSVMLLWIYYLVKRGSSVNADPWSSCINRVRNNRGIQKLFQFPISQLRVEIFNVLTEVVHCIHFIY